MPRPIPKHLPCSPCPHASSCCNYGVDLIGDEAARIIARYGADKVIVDEEGQQRTRADDDKCVFFTNGGCALHAEPEYPASCRGFPWRDGEDPKTPYQHDLDICPELTNDMDRTL